jgi:peptide/nickel transport system permease protein
MMSYIVKRLLMIIPMIVGVTIFLFFLLSMTPGDPAEMALGGGVEEEQLELFRQQYGLDKPLPIQYLNYMKGVIQGDLGMSFYTKQPVTSMIVQRVGVTLFLSLTSLALTIVVALFLGIAMAMRQNSFFDNFMRVFTVIISAMPQFWMALMLMLLFTVQLHWLPSNGLSGVKSTILPLVVLALSPITMCARTGRASLLEVINQDYIRTARSKGLRHSHIIKRHALKNSLLPMVTIYGRMMGNCFAGAVVIEIIFGINGIGRMMLDALKMKDVPAMMGSVIVSAVVIIIVNLLTDVVYTFIDPRIKSKYTKKSKKTLKVVSEDE